MERLVTVISMAWASFTLLKTLADITFWMVSVIREISEGKEGRHQGEKDS